MKTKHLDGIVLAGGLSSRANTNKMLLTYNGKFLINYTIESIRPFVDKIIVVTGAFDKEDREALKDVKGITFAYNKDFEKGMYSSILRGIEETTNDFLIIPGDVPFVHKETYEKVINASGDFIVPVYKEQTGHPILISKDLKEELFAHRELKRMKTYRDAHGFTKVNVEDQFCTEDIDNLDDYTRVIKILDERK